MSKRKQLLQLRVAVRQCSSAAASACKTSSGAACSPRPFHRIPGPRGPLGLGNIFRYLPLIGPYSWLALHKAARDKYEKYGPIVRETMVPGQDIVWLYDPNDIGTLLTERDYPLRCSHLALEKYRKDRPHTYRSAGLLPTNGAEWWRLRSEFQKEISAPKSVRSFLNEVDGVTQEFIDHLRPGEAFDVLPKLTRLNLELTCLLTFNERLNAFSPEEQDPGSRSSRLMHSAETTNSCILPTDQGLRLWRYFETRPYRQLRQAQEYMESVAVELVSQKLARSSQTSQNLQQDEGHATRMVRDSLIEKYLRNPKLDLRDVVGMAADLLLAGIDTTSYSMAFAIYHIARHEEVQRNLFAEAQAVLAEKRTALSAEVLNSQVPYTRAVLKEVFRLNPISVGVGRVLSRDLVFSGYQVPKGTVVVTQNMVACRLERNFPEPLHFRPERWLGQHRHSINPYLVLPFGHGMRACIARRLAEQNILVLLLRLVRNYEIIWRGSRAEMDVRTLLINKPSEPVSIALKDRM